MNLRHDKSGISELVILLLVVLLIIVVVAVLAGGIVLTVAVFFGGKLGIGFFLFVMAGLAFLGWVFIKPKLKQLLWGVYLLGFLGLVFLVLGVLGK